MNLVGGQDGWTGLKVLRDILGDGGEVREMQVGGDWREESGAEMSVAVSTGMGSYDLIASNEHMKAIDERISIQGRGRGGEE